MSGEIVTEKKNKFLSLITPRIHLRSHPFVSGQGFPLEKSSSYNRQKFYWPYAHFWISFT